VGHSRGTTPGRALHSRSDMQREQALQLVYDAIDIVNRQLPAARRLAKSRETIIIGPSGSLDSLGIVNFVITLEERAGAVLSKPVELLDGTALIDEHSPFQTVDTLARFLETLDS
jgi:hypothetical protein